MTCLWEDLKGVRTAIQALIDIALIAVRNQQGLRKYLTDTDDDIDGRATIVTLQKMLKLVNRVTGNSNGSLGLHPAVYFYGPTGRHSNPMFMGVMSLIGRKVSNNDQTFFNKFTVVREKLETILIERKDLIATILQKHLSAKRVEKHELFLDQLIDYLHKNDIPSDTDIVNIAGLNGKIVVGEFSELKKDFSDDDKSQVFIKSALSSAIQCPICNGYLDVEKSVSYDHIKRLQDGGSGSANNCQLTHPYCNQSVKN